MSIKLSEAFKRNVCLVAFDMDQTCLDIHTSGVAIRDGHSLALNKNAVFQIRKGTEVVQHVKPVIRELIPLLLKNNIAVAICTNTDVNMAIHPSLMGGRELVEYIFNNTFPEYPDICNYLIIEAWRGNINAVEACGKNNHLARVWERLDAEHKCYPIIDETPFQNFIRSYTEDYFLTLEHIPDAQRQTMIAHTLLIDDDPLNVHLAHQAGYLAYQAKPTGLEVADWEKIMSMFERSELSKDSSDSEKQE